MNARKTDPGGETEPPSLIFDFDGTIADTLREGFVIYNELAGQNEFTLVDPEHLDELRALDTRKLLRHLGIPKRKVPALLANGRRMLKERIRDLPLIPGMELALPRLHAQARCLGILTSNAVENVEAFLHAHDLRSLFTFISSTPKLSGKAKHLRSIARTFSLERKSVLYVGDEIRDLRAARKAGVGAVAVTWGFNSGDSLAREEPRYLVRTPAELVDLIASRARSC